MRGGGPCCPPRLAALAVPGCGARHFAAPLGRSGRASDAKGRAAAVSGSQRPLGHGAGGVEEERVELARQAQPSPLRGRPRVTGPSARLHASFRCGWSWGHRAGPGRPTVVPLSVCAPPPTCSCRKRQVFPPAHVRLCALQDFHGRLEAARSLAFARQRSGCPMLARGADPRSPGL